MKIVHVRWRDSCGVTPDWRDLNDLKPMDTVIDTVGYRLIENDLSITVAMSISPDVGEVQGQYCGCMTIPKCCIIETKEL